MAHNLLLRKEIREPGSGGKGIRANVPMPIAW